MHLYKNSKNVNRSPIHYRILNRRHSSNAEKRDESNNFAIKSFMQTMYTEKDKLFIEKKKKQYLHERYTFIKRKSISHLENLLKVWEDDCLKKNELHPHKLKVSKKSKNLPEKIEPIFSILPQIDIPKFSSRKISYS